MNVFTLIILQLHPHLLLRSLEVISLMQPLLRGYTLRPTVKAAFKRIAMLYPFDPIQIILQAHTYFHQFSGKFGPSFRSVMTLPLKEKSRFRSYHESLDGKFGPSFRSVMTMTTWLCLKLTFFSIITQKSSKKKKT